MHSLRVFWLRKSYKLLLVQLLIIFVNCLPQAIATTATPADDVIAADFRRWKIGLLHDGRLHTPGRDLSADAGLDRRRIHPHLADNAASTALRRDVNRARMRDGRERQRMRPLQHVQAADRTHLRQTQLPG